ncbi:RNA polymerase I specific transcription initiation factor RRN3 protein [Arabidopsis thaliana]|uniref:RNA polymerase I specific transcription initiation factor RRN3 protein n=2 Tax=Arabidopsis thaliana TaxID=3702 RepID=F4I6D6_ARATH|nr:RNA polymerase I specific transcription initiation factor RRN3 protein [Arabidopsis thaliana]AEE31247.1 RNA polymerase I specific transcription initiation factor RRN3 protein [Arabidopsis thaliana]|eukprot:NP_174347.1 RNA polymerase I specific transcription initiation factor RRN3 protein [Arabidopsis thaliana]
MGAEEFPSVPFNSNAMDNAEYTDTDLVFAVRKALASVQNGDTDDYSQLKTVMCLTEDADFDAVAQLETVLKSLSVSVAWIDLVHHKDLLEAMSLWYHSHRPSVMDALVDLIISLAATSGKYLDPCLNMLVRNFSQPTFKHKVSQTQLVKKMQEVHPRVHAALHKISYLIPLAPWNLVSILAQNMRKIDKKDPSIVTYVDNLLRLENSSIGEVVGSVILMMVMERMLDLDLVSGCDDSNGGMFDMELEDAVESTMNEGDEFPVGALKQNTSGGNVVSELLDKLMVLFFHHLESCQNSDRLDEVFEILFKSFENYILNTYKTKFSQFLMFYACSLDPENCGVRFASKLLDIYLSSNTCRLTRMSAVAYLASYLSRGKFLPASFVASMLKRLVDECAEYCGTCNDDVKPEAHQVFYSGCQAILYVLCFRMRSIVEIPRFQSQFRSLESILSHKLNPLLVCLPSVVSEFLKQAKAGGLFIVSESFIFDDLHESELSRAFGGFERLDTFFPFDPCLLKMSSSYISPNFNFWSMVKTTYGEDGDEELCDEVIVNGDADSAEEPDDDVELDSEMNTMSTTPKHSFMRETERLLKMPSRIRPSTSPPESFLI